MLLKCSYASGADYSCWGLRSASWFAIVAGGVRPVGMLGVVSVLVIIRTGETVASEEYICLPDPIAQKAQKASKVGCRVALIVHPRRKF